MSIKHFSAAGAAAISLLIAGCNGNAGSAGYVPKKAPPLPSAMAPLGEEASYFPFATGNQWTFDSEMVQMVNGRQGAPIKREITYKITKVEPGPGGSTLAYFQITDNGQVTDRQEWKVDKTGISQLAVGKTLTKFSTPQMVLPFPVKIGKKFGWKGTISANGEVRSGTTNSTVDGTEEVDSSAGTYNALGIVSIAKLSSAKTNSQLISKLWLSPRVGIVRYRQEAVGVVKDKKAQFAIVQVLKLKNASLKK